MAPFLPIEGKVIFILQSPMDPINWHITTNEESILSVLPSGSEEE